MMRNNMNFDDAIALFGCGLMMVAGVAVALIPVAILVWIITHW